MTERGPDEPFSALLVTDSLEYGGAERQVVALAGSLPRWNIQPIVCSLSAAVPLAKERGTPAFDLVIAKAKGRYDLSPIRQIARLIRERRISVVHGFLFKSEIFSVCGGFLARAPVIIVSERNANYQLTHVQRALRRAALPFYDLMIANSYAGKKFVQRVLGIPEDRVKVIHNGVDSLKFHPHPEAGRALRRDLGIGDGDLVVGMVASFKRQKHHGFFLDIARQLIAQRRDVRFLLVGDPVQNINEDTHAYYRSIRALAQAPGLRERCVFLSKRSDMTAVYNAMDLNCLTSLREGTSNTLLEAMACGVPVVATDVGDNSVIVQKGVTGCLVCPGDERIFLANINELLDDPLRRAQMGLAGKAWVAERFGLEEMVRKTAEAYRDCLRKKSPGALRTSGDGVSQ